MRGLLVCVGVGAILGLAARWVPQASMESSSALATPAVPTHHPIAREPAQSPASQRPSDGASGSVQAIGPRAEGGIGDAPAIAPESPATSGAATIALDRLAQLRRAGFPADRARAIVQREADLRRAEITREFTATGTIRALNGSLSAAIEQQLKDEMSEDDYERYVSASAERTRIRVASIEADSAAAYAGIEPGDEIMSYAGQRAFTLRQLSALMLSTPAGRIVPTTVMRDGQILTLYVSGGALGISAK